MKAKIHIFLKNGVLDVQGKAVEAALIGLGHSSVGNVRVGKLIELDIDASDKAGAQAQLKTMCETLLANTVIESYTIEVA